MGRNIAPFGIHAFLRPMPVSRVPCCNGWTHRGNNDATRASFHGIYEEPNPVAVLPGGDKLSIDEAMERVQSATPAAMPVPQQSTALSHLYARRRPRRERYLRPHISTPSSSSSTVIDSALTYHDRLSYRALGDYGGLQALPGRGVAKQLRTPIC